MIGRRGVRTLALAALLAVLWQSVFVVIPGAALCAKGAPAASVPVLLLEEPGYRDSLTDHPLLLRLSKEGYAMGKTIFVDAPSQPFFTLEAGYEWVDQKVEDALALTGAPKIDIVAFGITGLAARLAIESGYVAASRIRDLVMVASPNRGTFVAEILKSFLTVSIHESILERSTRIERYLQLIPTGGESGPAGTGWSGSISKKVPEPIPWIDETSWVAERSQRVYEPLYARYVAEKFYSIPCVPMNNPDETFQGWIYRNAPALWENLIRKGAEPPEVAGSPSYDSSGTGLSSAYYELLAMEVAKDQYVMKTSSQKGLLESLAADAYIPTSLEDAALHYGRKLLMHYAGKALVTIKAELQKWLAESLVRAVGFAGEPASPLLATLIREETLVNLGRSADHRFERVVANVRLGTLNRSSGEKAASRPVRFVSVVGRTANPWGVAWPQIGPNDLYCEVDCAVAPAGPRDVVKVFEGVLSTSHGGLRKDKKALEFIALTLARDGQVAGQGSAVPSDTRVPVSSWRPVYCDLEEGSSSLPSKSATVTLDMSDPPAGWRYLVWSELSQSSGSGYAVASPQVFVTGKTAIFRLEGQNRLGIRLTRSGPLNPPLGASKVQSAFQKEVTARVQLRLKASDDAIMTANRGGAPGLAVPGRANSSGDVTPDNRSSVPGTPPPVIPAIPTSEAEQDFESDSGPDYEQIDETTDADGVPVVRVVYRSKHTSLKQPCETYHGWWVADFGDGTVRVLQGEPLLDVSHTYREGGKYEVTLTSYDNNGVKLLEKRTSARVYGDGDLTQSFRAESLGRIPVDVILTGPVKWVTGKTADFRVCLWTDLPKNVTLVDERYDPGPHFRVLWERSGDFEVQAAVTVKLRYELEGGVVTVENTYMSTVPVAVLTTGVTR